MGRISNSIEIAKASWHVLQADKELLALPIISGAASLITAASFIVPLAASGRLDGEPGALSYIIMLLMYVVLAYITIFFNAALVDAANDRLRGRDPTVATALAGARMRAGKILPWAIVSATVSVVLRAIEERAGFLGQILAGLAGLAWAVVTFLVLPIIVIEGLSVGDAIKKSSQMFKRTWGENLAAQVGFGLLGLVAVLPAVVVVLAAAAVGGPGVAIGIGLAVIWVIVVSVVMAALSVIFQTALYHYAATGQVPGGFFSESSLSAAFRSKRR